ncbi:MAG: endolytic transglycosylase MltG [Clostridia bacterium]|nr:endolytic transglycosylase MltG [Clostridia bacterium]
MAKRRKNIRKEADRLFKPRRYTRETVYKDREYGVFWYAWLWQALRPFLIFMCALLIVIGLVSSAWDMVYTGYIAAPDDSDASIQSFTIASGESISTIGTHLEEQGFIRSPSVFKYYIQFYGLTNDIQSGVYSISKDMNVFDVVEAISSGNAVNERTIRIIPGWTCEDIADYLVSAGAIGTRDDFLNACRDYEKYLGSSLALINANEEAELQKRTYPLEGYLAPDTYRVYLSADSDSIIKTLLTQNDKVYTSLFPDETAYDEYGNIVESDPDEVSGGYSLTNSEVYTLASIIEKEASSAEDMARVSAVFHNRLKAGMRLESDPTATYLTDTVRLALTDADTSVNTAYNTYRISGLPVGPICNPSKNALNAAMNPDETYLNENYLFFCAAEPGTGKLVFAKTNEEHEKNVAKYRPLWIEYDIKNSAK